MWQLPPSTFSSQHTSHPQHPPFSFHPQHHPSSFLPQQNLPQAPILPQPPLNSMAFTTKDPHMADVMEMVRSLATLETELRIEREQHALAQQCITHMARQLATRDQRSATPAFREDTQYRGRKLERPEAEPRRDGGREQMVKQKVGEDDLLTWGDENMPVDSVHSPILIPKKTRPVPTGPGSEQTFRAKCLAFLKQNEAKNEPVDTSKKEGTLLTFENSGDVSSENMLPSISSDARSLPALKGQNAKTPDLLTLKSLSDRYKNQTPTDKGISSSRWAKPEEKITKPEEQEDLMQFPEDDEEASEDTAVEKLEESLTEEQMEEAKQKHAAELRKNQALVMYDPAPSEDTFRTVLVTDIPQSKSETDVMRMVSGGMIVKVQSMNTQLMNITPSIKSKTMTITFLQAKDARNFVRSVEDKVEPKFSLLKTPSYPVNGYLADDMMYNGISRCLAVQGLHEDITLETLCRATRPPGTKRDNVLDASRDEQGVCHLEFTSVLAAVAGRWELKDNLFRRFTRTWHEADPCDCKISGTADEEGVKEEDGVKLSESEIDESGDATEEDSETQAGAESESKSSAGEKDADGWPVGGLDYD
ncbi:hypothetical protein E4T52_06731 [Aureobasidium sp. EXF-3400]|nr:hypothetical protein E4T51_05929 [Aureobasidium sp. EXF-12344]KAI4778355.1 hypothetical protein E4T52_06731 [Aureobasidium sp. EXF-3400]